MYTLRLRHHFDSAHKLNDYKGACFNVHGHRWEVEITIKTKELQEDEMVIDFKRVKELINQFDHQLILKECEENKKIIESLQGQTKMVLVNFKPTAENLAKFLTESIKEQVMIESQVSVTIWESPEASITYED